MTPAEILALADSEQSFTRRLLRPMNPTQTRPSSALAGSQRSPVQESIDNQSKQISELFAVVSAIKERLRPVRNIPPVNPGAPEPCAPDPVLVTAKVDQNTRMISAATNELNDLISELIV